MDAPAAVYVTLLVVVTSCRAEMTVVDMTFTLDNETIYWPGNPPFQFNIIKRENTSAGFWYESNSFFTPEHGGTHVDAPAHFYHGKWRVDQIPASRLVGSAAVVNVQDKVFSDSDYRLTKQDVLNWEAENGRLPDKAIVIMNSGWGSRYPNPYRVFNTATPSDSSTFHFPGIHPEAAIFLSTERGVIAVGVDTPSIDYGQSQDFQTHVTLGEHNVIGLENVANVGDLPSSGATVVVGVVKLRDGSGGPARILGLVAAASSGGVAVVFLQGWVFGMILLLPLMVMIFF